MNIKCYSCGAELEADEDMRIQRVACPACGGNVKIPTRLAATDDTDLPPANAVSSSRPPITDDQIYQRIADELASNTREEALWTKCLALSDGDESRTKAKYIKERHKAIRLLNRNPPAMSDEWIAKYKGVKGWLLLFVIGLVLLSPVLNFLMLQVAYHDAKPLAQPFPGYYAAVQWNIWISVIVTVYGFVVGWKIMSGDPWADVSTRRFLVIQLLLGFAMGVVYLLKSDLPSEFRAKVFDIALQTWIQAGMGFAIWFTYFCKSKRVKATFSGK